MSSLCVTMDDYDRKTHSQLLAYLRNTLLSDKNSTVLPSSRALLKSEYSTTQHASKLYSYYKSKPNLRAYTLEKELHRMDYVVQVNDGRKERQLTKPKEIQHYFAQNEENHNEPENIILRASNQSILADMVNALTGDDKLIRPTPFMVTGVASHCQFHIDLRNKTESGKKGVTALSTLLISMPSGYVIRTGMEGNDRLNLAKIHVRVQFYLSSDNGSQVQYEICSVEPLLQLPRDDHFIFRASKSLSRDTKRVHPSKALPCSKIVPKEKEKPERQEYQVSPIMFLCSQAKQHIDSLRKQELDQAKTSCSGGSREGSGQSKAPYAFQFQLGQVKTKLRFD